jgi:hypothetical protein
MDLSLIKGIVDRAIAGIKQEFASVERLRATCDLHTAMPADGVVTTAVCRVVLLNALAGALGLDTSDPDIIDKAIDLRMRAENSTEEHRAKA